MTDVQNNQNLWQPQHQLLGITAGIAYLLPSEPMECSKQYKLVLNLPC